MLKPRLRGKSHFAAFVAALPLGVLLGLAAETARERTGVITFAAAVAVMFGASALYHRGNWSDRLRRWMRALDHAGIFILIAGTYTAFGLLVLDGAWRWAVLAIVWAGAACAVLLNVAWKSSPQWLTGVLAIALGWIGAVVAPKFAGEIGAGGVTLVVAGGLAYTAGAVIFAMRRPNPFPATFGYHEVFHVLVITAVACHYAAVSFFAMPGA
ncbi:MAG: PAQR family membrane homeostasis protein TrhA [Gaiellaceae bacterium]